MIYKSNLTCTLFYKKFFCLFFFAACYLSITMTTVAYAETFDTEIVSKNTTLEERVTTTNNTEPTVSSVEYNAVSDVTSEAATSTTYTTPSTTESTKNTAHNATSAVPVITPSTALRDAPQTNSSLSAKNGTSMTSWSANATKSLLRDGQHPSPTPGSQNMPRLRPLFD